MPDIKTALEKVLNEWEPPTATPPPAPTTRHFSVTNNVTRVTFAYVRDNPGKTRVEVAKALEMQGFKASSVSSLLGQMLKQGMMRESTHLLYVTTNEYATIKSAKALAAKPQEPQRKIVTITRRAAPVAEPTPEVKEWSPNDVIDKLTLRQALALFKELRNILVN
jgi:predicted SPOUT superfamily RNA methylase MTH1